MTGTSFVITVKEGLTLGCNSTIGFGSIKCFSCTIIDKSLGTLLHFWGVYQFTQVQPLASPHKNVGRMSRIFSGWEREGELQENSEKDVLFNERTEK